MSNRPAVFQNTRWPEIGQFIGAQSNALNYERERDDKLIKARKQQNEFDAGLKAIDDAKVADSGLNPVDAVKNQAVPALQAEAFRKLQAGESAMAVKAWLDPQVAKLSAAYTTAKNSKAIIDASLPQLAKDFEGGDIAKVKAGAYNEASKDILEMDENGNFIGVKDVTTIAPDKNYTSKYTDPQNLGSWYNASGKLKEFSEGIKLNEISGSDKFDNKGRVTKHGYKGKENVLLTNKILDKDGDVIGVETVHETVKDKEGNELKVLPPLQEQQILSDPRRAAELNQIVARDLAAAEAATGKPIEDKEAQLYMRHKLFQLMDEYSTHTFNTNDEVKIPKPPVTNIYNRSGGAGAQAPTVRQMYKGIVGKVTDPETPSIKVGGSYLGMPMNELDSAESEAIVNEVKKAKGITDVNIDNWFLRVEDGKLKVYKFDADHPKPETEAEAKAFKLPASLITVSEEGTDIKAQVRSKEKAEVVKQNQGRPKVVEHKPTSKYVEVKEVNGVKWGRTKDGKIEKVQ